MSSLTTPKNVTDQGAKSQPQMNPGCFHSFHSKCSLCKDVLQKIVQELGEIAKEAILHPHATDTGDHNESTTASMTDSTVDEENHGVREMKEKYENLIEKLNKLANLSPPPQPCIASHVNQQLSQNTHVIQQPLGPHHIAANAIILYEATREKIIQ